MYGGMFLGNISKCLHGPSFALVVDRLRGGWMGGIQGRGTGMSVAFFFFLSPARSD